MRFLSTFFIILSIVCSLVYGQSYRPVVLMHGVTTGADAMAGLESWIREALPGVYILNVEIGNGKFDSIFKTMDYQVEEFTSIVQADQNLAGGFNLIGFSQGTLITRAYIQRTNSPAVYNYISLSGPQAGQYGTPFVNIKWVDKVLSSLTYEKKIQKTIAPAEYWKNPFNIEKYLERSLFLADINNELPTKNTTYKDNLSSLNAMVLSYSISDKTIVPRESGWFSFFADGSNTEVVPLQNQPQYTEDWIGLRTLDEAGRLHFVTVDCKHSEIPNDISCKPYFTNFTLPFLQN